MTNLQFTQAQGPGYTRGMYRVTLSSSCITRTLSLSKLQTGHSNQRVKLKYLCTALITAWMGEDSALKANYYTDLR